MKKPWNKVETIIDGDEAYKMVSNGRFKIRVDADMAHILEDNIIIVCLRSGYAYNTTPINGVNQKIEIHRMVMGLEKGDGKIVDHIDRNTFNNKRSNLRLATPAQNAANKAGSKKSTSIFKGVSKKCGLFNVRLNKDGINYYLGKFEDEVEAAKAYDRKAVELYGEFAFTNFTGDTCNVPSYFKTIKTDDSERKGEQCVRKLTSEQAMEAIEMYKEFSQRYIANHFGVSRELIRSILVGRTYKELQIEK